MFAAGRRERLLLQRVFEGGKLFSSASSVFVSSSAVLFAISVVDIPSPNGPLTTQTTLDNTHYHTCGRVDTPTLGSGPLPFALLFLPNFREGPRSAANLESVSQLCAAPHHLRALGLHCMFAYRC